MAFVVWSVPLAICALLSTSDGYIAEAEGTAKQSTSAGCECETVWATFERFESRFKKMENELNVLRKRNADLVSENKRQSFEIHKLKMKIDKNESQTNTYTAYPFGNITEIKATETNRNTDVQKVSRRQ